MNWTGKNRRENKKPLSEALAGKHAVENEKLYVKVLGMIHFETAQRESERERVVFPPKAQMERNLRLVKEFLERIRCSRNRRKATKQG